MVVKDNHLIVYKVEADDKKVFTSKNQDEKPMGYNIKVVNLVNN